MNLRPNDKDKTSNDINVLTSYIDEIKQKEDEIHDLKAKMDNITTSAFKPGDYLLTYESSNKYLLRYIIEVNDNTTIYANITDGMGISGGVFELHHADVMSKIKISFINRMGTPSYTCISGNSNNMIEVLSIVHDMKS